MERQIIEEKIERMASLEDKQVLKELLQQVLGEIVEYQKKEYEKIRSSLEEELLIKENEYPLLSAIVSREKYSTVDSWLHPVIEGDDKATKIDWSLVKLSLRAGMEANVGRVFLKMPLQEVKKMMEEQPEFPAVIHTSERDLRAKVELRFAEEYLDKLQEIKDAFGKNEISWRPILDAYFLRFFYLNIVECVDKIEDNEELLSMEPQYGEYQECILENHILLWNLDLQKRKTLGFPVPQMDQKKYRFSFEIEKAAEAYLVLLKEDEYVVRKEHKLEIYSPNSSMHDWKCYYFEKKQLYVSDITFPILDNTIRETFSNRMARYGGKIIRTKAELERVIQEIQVEEYLQLEGIKILDAKDDMSEADMIVATENYNSMLSRKPVLLLQFSGRAKENWIEEDVMKYALEVVQDSYYEFQVKGILL
ncbi:MAG: hypothetical protein HDT30_05405 [Clostridiales bacterium]|nr:hypothetical protein [Clostridiales bacterium]